MLGNFGLRKAKDFLEVTDTKRTTCEQMDDPQPGGVAETLVNRDQLHALIYAPMRIYVNRHLWLRHAALLGRVDHENTLERTSRQFAGLRSYNTMRSARRRNRRVGGRLHNFSTYRRQRVSP